MKKKKTIKVSLTNQDMRFVCAYMGYFSTVVREMDHPYVADEMLKIGELMYGAEKEQNQDELDTNLANLGVCKWYASNPSMTIEDLRDHLDMSHVPTMKARRSKSPIAHEITTRDLRFAWALMHVMSVMADELAAPSEAAACEGMAQAIEMILGGKAGPEIREAPAVGSVQLILGCKWYADEHLTLERFMEGNETIRRLAKHARKLKAQ